jgi:hypothetical protein
VSARHKKKRILFTHNRKLSKITVATAGVAVAVPAAVFAGIATSGASAGDPASLLAMAGSQPGARPAAAHLDRGERLTGVARREVASLGAARVRAQRAAERAADRRAARRAAARAAAQAATAATSAPSPSSQAPAGSAPSPSGNPQKIAAAMLGSYGWSSSQFGCLVSLWNAESGWDVHASNRLFEINRDRVSGRSPGVSAGWPRSVIGGCRGCRRCGPGGAGSRGCGRNRRGGPPVWRSGSGSRTWRS